MVVDWLRRGDVYLRRYTRGWTGGLPPTQLFLTGDGASLGYARDRYTLWQAQPVRTEVLEADTESILDPRPGSAKCRARGPLDEGKRPSPVVRVLPELVKPKVQ